MLQDSRKQIVNFRVTQSEYADLKHRGKEAGCRSVSAYVRHVLLGGQNGGPAPAADWQQAVNARLEQLEEALARLQTR